jgi:malate permease and related proteins
MNAFIPTCIKMLLVPLLTGIGLTLIGFSGEARLALVLMAGMPINSANLILAEKYDLDRELSASSVLLSTIVLPFLVPLWRFTFG